MTPASKSWPLVVGATALALAFAAPTASAAPAGDSFSAVQDQVTSGQRNAIRSAEQYLEISGFSRKGLIDQLEYEGFSTADATFAVDSLAVDWNEQAARSAKQYLELTSFSRSGLIDQLVYEGFTRAQAEYGANAAY
ncbi:Ltp family lipoprotein [Nocardia sp. NPDC050697]|uniref:Ltp family lipoprotein n=1 Tax=Nocardia sp. NPDC050697 TaxID=3155158 RepID=UPI0033F7D431